MPECRIGAMDGPQRSRDLLLHTDLQTLFQLIRQKNFGDDEFSERDAYKQKEPFLWFDVYKEAMGGELDGLRCFLAVVSAMLRRWWTRDDKTFESFPINCARDTTYGRCTFMKPSGTPSTMPEET